jgi:hypothetical protein
MRPSGMDCWFVASAATSSTLPLRSVGGPEQKPAPAPSERHRGGWWFVNAEVWVRRVRVLRFLTSDTLRLASASPAESSSRRTDDPDCRSSSRAAFSIARIDASAIVAERQSERLLVTSTERTEQAGRARPRRERIAPQKGQRGGRSGRGPVHACSDAQCRERVALRGEVEGVALHGEVLLVGGDPGIADEQSVRSQGASPRHRDGSPNQSYGTRERSFASKGLQLRGLVPIEVRLAERRSSCPANQAPALSQSRRSQCAYTEIGIASSPLRL